MSKRNGASVVKLNKHSYDRSGGGRLALHEGSRRMRQDPARLVVARMVREQGIADMLVGY